MTMQIVKFPRKSNIEYQMDAIDFALVPIFPQHDTNKSRNLKFIFESIYWISLDKSENNHSMCMFLLASKH